MSALVLIMVVTRKGNKQMTKTLTALALLLLNIALFLVAVYAMILDEYGYTFVYTYITFLLLPASIFFLAHAINENLSK